ncbi:MAG: hypothetical protein AAFX87_10865 [Bacteroidota bacterium]
MGKVGVDYQTKVNILENGNILWSKHENKALVLEVGDQDSIRVHREYYIRRITLVKKDKE